MGQNLLPANTRVALGKPAEKMAYEARKKAYRQERDNVFHVRVAQRRLGTLLKQAKDAGGDIHSMPLWRLVGYAVYGNNPRPIPSPMDGRDRKVPAAVWGPLIASMPEGVSLHAISYGHRAPKPEQKLWHLGMAYYGVMALADNGASTVKDREVVGVLMFDQLGRTAVSAGIPPLPQSVHRAHKPSAHTKNIEQAGLLADFEYPEEWCTAEGELSELEAAFKRLSDSNQLKTFGL